MAGADHAAGDRGAVRLPDLAARPAAPGWVGLMCPRLIAPIALIAALAGCAWYAHSSGKQSGMATTQAAWDKAKLLTLEAQGEQIILAQIREGELTAQMDKLKRTHRETQTRIAADHAALVDGLRNRPEARASAGGVPEGAAVGVGCTGAGLARPDAAFLAGYGADAAQLQAGFDTCKAALDSLTR
jgi:hypothetical protein